MRTCPVKLFQGRDPHNLSKQRLDYLWHMAPRQREPSRDDSCVILNFFPLKVLLGGLSYPLGAGTNRSKTKAKTQPETAYGTAFTTRQQNGRRGEPETLDGGHYV